MLRHLAVAIPNGSIRDRSLIQNSATSGATFVFFAFDRCNMSGKITRAGLCRNGVNYSAALRSNDSVQLSESLQTPAEQMLALVQNHGLEGVAAKRLFNTYEQGRQTGGMDE